jgi:predicted metal-dependent hydrolase
MREVRQMPNLLPGRFCSAAEKVSWAFVKRHYGWYRWRIEEYEELRVLNTSEQITKDIVDSYIDITTEQIKTLVRAQCLLLARQVKFMRSIMRKDNLPLDYSVVLAEELRRISIATQNVYTDVQKLITDSIKPD